VEALPAFPGTVRRVRVEVTRKDIWQADMHSITKCAVARAMTRALGT
jgi:hypothetical protein